MKLWESAPATIEVDGQEVARIQWPPTLSEDTLWLDLGRSPFVQVKRTQIRDVKETRPIGNMIHRRFTYTLAFLTLTMLQSALRFGIGFLSVDTRTSK